MMTLKTSHIARLLCTAAIATAMVACDKGGDAGGDAPEGSAQSACAKATAHLASFAAGPGASGMEAMAAKAATKAAKSKCDKEGLSDEQLACIMKVKTFRDYFTLGKCPAIEKKMPSWLKLGNPDAIISGNQPWLDMTPQEMQKSIEDKKKKK